VAQTAELIAERFAAWGEVPPIVGQVFGAADPAAMAARLERFCRHDDRFDFVATAAGAEWIDATARAAQAIADRLDAGDRVVGHADWRAEHLRFDRGALSAVFDWDSVIVEREPVLLGGAAHGFTANFVTAPSRGQRPALSDSLASIDEYEAHRGPPFSPQEQQLALAALVYSMAYAARCEHSDAQLMSWGEPTAPPDSARAFVAAHAADLLGRARGRQPS
jgi:hypothetical protein